MNEPSTIRQLAQSQLGPATDPDRTPEQRREYRMRQDLYTCTAEVCERLDRVIELLKDDPERSS